MYGLLLYNFVPNKSPLSPSQKNKQTKKLLKWIIYGGKRSAEGAAAEVSLSSQFFFASATHYKCKEWL